MSRDSLENQLQELHHEQPSADTVLVVEPDPCVRTVCERLISHAFPSQQVEAVATVAAARELITGDLRSHVSLVFADTAEFNSVAQLIEDLRGGADSEALVEHGNRLPVILTSAGLPRGWSLILQQMLHDEKKVDGVLDKPFSKDDVERVFASSISRRAGLFEEMEGTTRDQVLDSFASHYLELARLWRGELQALSLYDSPDEDKVGADLEVILGNMESLIATLRLLKSFLPIRDDEHLGAFIHKINGDLTVIIGYLDFVLAEDLPSEDLSCLRKFQAEARELAAAVGIVSNARASTITWAQAATSDKQALAPQVLKFPQGTVFCVIDDTPDIHGVCGRLIEKAGGEVVSATDEATLRPVLDGLYRVDVVLLDHELEGGAEGHQLIEAIRRQHPEALIIAHTGKADALNADPGNPYKAAGVEIVGKRHWNAVSGIIRRKLVVPA